MQTLTALGLSDQGLSTLVEWAKDKTASLQLRVEEKTTFVEEVVREVEGSTRKETTGHLGKLTAALSTKACRRQHYWSQST